MALEQDDPELSLQLRHGLGESRLGDVQPARGACDLSVFGDGDDPEPTTVTDDVTSAPTTTPP